MEELEEGTNWDKEFLRLHPRGEKDSRDYHNNRGPHLWEPPHEVENNLQVQATMRLYHHSHLF
ncbi:MAG TPA: hypothetical protein DIT97_29865 [Gimesia maris]|uniref:Uncharacterized protein n=1 Tax=Gimesia maris TaxID=122 RepID=A0A3D3RHB4_9PLAN|nr:hypothetical protein [Gimesia maris]